MILCVCSCMCHVILLFVVFVCYVILLFVIISVLILTTMRV